MLNDLHFAFRKILKSPGFTAIAVLTLAIGIGANTAIFSLINALLLKPLPYPDSDRIVSLFQKPNARLAPFSGGIFMDFEDQVTQFENFAYQASSSLNFTGIEEPARLNGIEVSANYLKTLGVKPALGSDFSEECELPGGDARVVILSDSTWRSLFAADPDIVNRQVTLDYQSYTVIGVLPPKALISDVAYLAPGAIRANEWKQDRGYSYVIKVIGRLKDDATIDSARTELETIKTNMIDLYPEMMKDWGISVATLQESIFGQYKPYAMTLLVAVGFLLLVACVNVANLMLARASTRQGEISVRATLGAPPWAIARQLLCESSLLAIFGGLIGLVLAIFSLKPLAMVVGLDQTLNITLEIDSTVLLFTIGASLVTGIVFGVFPAFKAARMGVVSGLRDSTRSSTSAGGHRIQAVLVIVEMALTVVLLVSIGLLLKSFAKAIDVDPGFNKENVLTFEITRSGLKAPEMADYVRFADQVLERVESIPGVMSVGMISSTPMNGNNYFGSPLWRDDQPDTANKYFVGIDSINGDSFKTLGIPLLKGRLFNRADQIVNQDTDTPKPLIVNEQVVDDLFPDEDPIGKIVRDDNQVWEIVGVVGTIRPYGLDTPTRGMSYRPQAVWPWATSYVVRTQLPPLTITSQIRDAIHQIDSEQPIDRIRTLESAVKETLKPRIIMVSLIGVFGAISIFLAAIGIYGLMAYLVEQRQREIGIRLAIGALPSEIVRMVIKRGAILAAIGCGIGITAVIGLGRFLAFLLFNVEPYDPVVLVAVTVITISIATLASWRPARGASKLSPSDALRLE